MLKFKVSKQTLTRLDSELVVAGSRNWLTANFEFDEIWQVQEPKIATFNRTDKDNCCYNVAIVDGSCKVPWEVLSETGTLEISVQGGDLITTNPTTVLIRRSGALNGLVPTEASSSVYNWIVDKVKYITDTTARFLSGDFSDVDLETGNINAKDTTMDNLVVNKKANIVEIISDFTTSTYSAVKNKLKFSSNGFDLSVESTKTKDKSVYEHQIKTSNSKMQINASDLEINSYKNERHNINGKLNIDAHNIEMRISPTLVFSATSSGTKLGYDTGRNIYGSAAEFDNSNVRIKSPCDLSVISQNERHILDDDYLADSYGYGGRTGTYEIYNQTPYNANGAGINRLVNANLRKFKSTKMYLSGDKAVIGVSNNINGTGKSDFNDSTITTGISISDDKVDIIGKCNLEDKALFNSILSYLKTNPSTYTVENIFKNVPNIGSITNITTDKSSPNIIFSFTFSNKYTFFSSGTLSEDETGNNWGDVFIIKNSKMYNQLLNANLLNKCKKLILFWDGTDSSDIPCRLNTFINLEDLYVYYMTDYFVGFENVPETLKNIVVLNDSYDYSVGNIDSCSKSIIGTGDYCLFFKPTGLKCYSYTSFNNKEGFPLCVGRYDFDERPFVSFLMNPKTSNNKIIRLNDDYDYSFPAPSKMAGLDIIRYTNPNDCFSNFKGDGIGSFGKIPVAIIETYMDSTDFDIQDFFNNNLNITPYNGMFPVFVDKDIADDLDITLIDSIVNHLGNFPVKGFECCNGKYRFKISVKNIDTNREKSLKFVYYSWVTKGIFIGNDTLYVSDWGQYYNDFSDSSVIQLNAPKLVYGDKNNQSSVRGYGQISNTDIPLGYSVLDCTVKSPIHTSLQPMAGLVILLNRE